MASKAVGIRIPDDLLNLVEAYGKENFAKGDDYDKTETLLSLIRKGLGLDSVQQSVDESVLQNVQRKLDNCLTKDEFEKTITPLQNRLNNLRNAFESIVDKSSEYKAKLTEFDKGFQSWGAVVNEHDQILSQPIATKEDVQKAIASLRKEIEDLRNTFNSTQTDDEDDDDESSQGITKASLTPIFNDDGVSVAVLASNLNMTRQSLEERRDNGTLKELGYTAKKEGRFWKYYRI